MIDKILKKYFKTLKKKILTPKISEKKNFARFQREYLQQKKLIQKLYFFVFLIYKGAKYKHG